MSNDFKQMVTRAWATELRTRWVRDIEGAFARQGQPSGAPWAPLKPAYAAWKMQHGYGSLIGTLMGRLRNSIVGRADTMRGRVEVKSQGVDYAGYFAGKTKHSPARPFLPTRISLDNDAQGVFNSKVRRFARRVNGN